MDADCMTYLGMTAHAAVRAFGWAHVANWVRHLPPMSYVMRHYSREESKKKDRKNLKNRHFGHGAVPVSSFDEWYYGGDTNGR